MSFTEFQSEILHAHLSARKRVSKNLSGKENVFQNIFQGRKTCFTKIFQEGKRVSENLSGKENVFPLTNFRP